LRVTGHREEAPALASSWSVAAAAPRDAPPLPGTETTDILIVGGGISGVSTALNLALLGHKPILVEADATGAGATGASGGIVAPQIVRHGLDAVVRRLGLAHAGDLLRLVAASGDYVFDLARSHAPGAEAEQTGFVAPAMSRDGLRRLGETTAAWGAYRKNVEMLSAEALVEMGVRGYAGALLDRSGGMINPLRYAQDLAQAAIAAGARIYCGTPITALSRRGTEWEASSPNGRISARRVVLAANGGNARLHPRLRRTVLPLGVCEVTTAPLDPMLRAQLLPGRQSLTDIEADVFTIRYDRAGGLVTAYPADRIPADIEAITGSINARLAAVIPGWRPLPLSHVWQGTAWINTSLLPRLIAVEEGLIAIQACNGRGLAINSILGRDLARWLDGPQSVRPPLPLEAPKRISGYFAARYAPRLIMAAALVGKRVRQAFAPSLMAQES
jgi:glycine/D-amino acid oxidase-like deaminating enzyme